MCVLLFVLLLVLYSLF